MFEIKSFTFKKSILLSLVLYIFLSSISYHPDPFLTMLWASLTSTFDFNIYQYIATHPEENIGMFNYNPFLYFILKIQYFIALLFSNSSYKDWLRVGTFKAVHSSNIFQYTFTTKIFVIIAVFYCAYILYKLVQKKTHNLDKAKKSVLIWLLNPITIYATALMGQNDVFAIALFLTGWYLLDFKFLLSLICFGLSIATKNYPLIWLVILISATNFKSTLKKILAYSLPILITILTFLPFVKIQAFRNEMSNSISERMFISDIDLGFEDKVIIIPTLLLLLTLVILYHNYQKITFSRKAFLVLTANLIVLGFMHFHVQWFIWLVPFWTIWILSQNKKRLSFNIFLSLIIFFSWLTILFLFKDQSLYFGIFSPISIGLQAFPNFPYIFDQLKLNWGKYNNFAHSAIASIAILSLIKSIQLNSKND